MAKPTINEAELQARIAQLEAEVAARDAALSAKNNGKLTLKISEKGAVSAYGLGRFPVTLYGEQWRRLLSQADTITTFLDTHASELATKDNPRTVSAKPATTTATAVAKGNAGTSTVTAEQLAVLKQLGLLK